MRKFLTVWLLLFAVNAFGQIDKSELRDIAFGFYRNGQFDSAAFYYEQILQKPLGRSSSYFYAQLGDCYYQLGQLEKAKENYILCVSDTFKTHFFSIKRDCVKNLVDLLLAEKEYEKALGYLRKAESELPHFRICSNGEFGKETMLSYKFAQCFAGIGQLDSAMNYLTPYMFSEPYGMDSLGYIEIVEFYIIILKKKYSDAELKLELKNAIKQMYYKKEKDEEWEPLSPGEEFYNVLCYFTFYGQKVLLVDGGYEAKSWGGEPVKEFKKRSFIKFLKRTPTYKRIVN